MLLTMIKSSLIKRTIDAASLHGATILNNGETRRKRELGKIGDRFVFLKPK